LSRRRLPQIHGSPTPSGRGEHWSAFLDVVGDPDHGADGRACLAVRLDRLAGSGLLRPVAPAGAALFVAAPAVAHRSRAGALALLALGAAPPAAVAWWSIVVPALGVLTLAVGWFAIRHQRDLRPPDRAPGEQQRTDPLHGHRRGGTVPHIPNSRPVASVDGSNDVV
jgi:hypothetical protein